MSYDQLPVGSSLDDACGWLFERLETGAICPCCLQYAKIYRRKIHSGMARVLIAQYRQFGRSWAHTSKHFDHISREGAKLAYWDLMESDGTLREDGGHAGHWRITQEGVDYLHGGTVSKYAHTYGPVVQWYSGPEVDIHAALGTQFRLDELMRGD